MKRKLKILFISESFPPYANGGGGISTSLIVKSISKKCDCKIITQKFNNETPWKFEGFDVLPIMNNYSPNFNSPWKFVRSLSRNIFYRKIFRRIKKQIKDFGPDLINVQMNHYSLINKIVSLGYPTVLDFMDTMLACPIMLRMQPCISANKSCSTRECNLCLKNYFSIKYQDKRFIKNLLKFFVPIIIYSHVSKKENFVNKINSSKNSIVYANSKFINDLLINQGIFDSKVFLNYNICNLPNFKGKINRKNQIVFAGSVDFSKGVFAIIEAIRILNNKNLKVIILGNGPELDKAKRLTKKYNLNIDFLGQVSQEKVYNFYKKSKIILGPSIWPEPFGRFILDAISTQTPIVATNVGGTPEGIKDHETGLLVEPNNPKQLAKAIKELLTNKKLYNKIVRNLGKEAWKYSPEIIGKQRLELYQRLINQHNHDPKK